MKICGKENKIRGISEHFLLKGNKEEGRDYANEDDSDDNSDSDYDNDFSSDDDF